MPRNMMYKEILKGRFGCCSAEHVMPPHGYWQKYHHTQCWVRNAAEEKSSTSELLVYIAEVSEVSLGSILAECYIKPLNYI